jgi:NitT/TauT family transport system permease protein
MSGRRFIADHERAFLGLAGLITALAIWEAGARLGFLNPLFFSSPTDVIAAAQSDVFLDRIVEDLTTSLSELVVGVALGALVGIFIGFCAGWFRHVNYVLDPWITVLYSTPKVALVPLVILVLGIGFESKVFIVGLMALFSVLINTLVGVQTSRGPLLAVARSFGASGPMQVRTVVLPMSVPFIIVGLRLAIGHGMVGVIVAEIVGGTHGLGSLLRYGAFSLQTSLIILAVLMIGLWGVLSGEVMRRIEQRVEMWRPA